MSWIALSPCRGLCVHAYWLVLGLVCAVLGRRGRTDTSASLRVGFHRWFVNGWACFARRLDGLREAAVEVERSGRFLAGVIP